MDLNQYEIDHINLLKETANECCVLLKYNNGFPVQNKNIVLVGSGARKTIKGGTGSGEVNSRFYITIEQGLKNKGFNILSNDWLDKYDELIEKTKKRFVKNIKKEARRRLTLSILYSFGKVMKEPEYDFNLDYETDTCIYVLSRICGEGDDRTLVKGDFYLTESEIKDILYCNKHYKNFILVLNVGNVIDLSPIINEVENILLIYQLGIVGGDILADILLGNLQANGRLPNTWAKYENYSSYNNFRNDFDTDYKEGIYVGYKYFDSFKKKCLFPFGYGLSITKFIYELQGFSYLNNQICLNFNIKNIGNFSDKEVLEIYYTCLSNKYERSYKKLISFNKSKLINPNENTKLNIIFDLELLSIYDKNKKLNLIEKGNYIIKCSDNGIDFKNLFVININEDIYLNKTINLNFKPDFLDINIDQFWINEDISDLKVLNILNKDYVPTKRRIIEKDNKILNYLKELNIKDLIKLSIGNFNRGISISSIVGNSSNKVCGAAGDSYSKLSDLKSLSFADGTCGLRLAKKYYKKKNKNYVVGNPLPSDFNLYLPKFLLRLISKSGKNKKIINQYCTAIPIPLAVSSSFNLDLAYQYGKIIGKEMEIFNVDIWLAPGINIIRNPLCGRNFEYYSEDPILSGLFAANISNGVLEYNKFVCLKHYAANNQEHNRYQNSSNLSEFNLRETYLKSFEIAIKYSNIKCIMSSYNLINKIHTSENKLLLNILRDEFYFNGIIISDWVVSNFTSTKGKYRTQLPTESIKAGNNIYMPGCYKNYKDVYKDYKKRKISRNELENNAYYYVNLIKNN